VKESPIFTKTYDLLLWLLPVTTKFPREYRFLLTKAVQETALRFQERLIEASLGRGRTTTRALAQADVELTKLRFYLRLCLDLQLFRENQYHHVSQMVAEIGKLLGGWRKSTGMA